MKDYFEVLDIDEQTGEQGIKKAYLRMLEKYPAEKFPEKNRDIEEAYEALTNPRKRHSCIEFHRMSDASKQAYRSAVDDMGKGDYPKAARTLEKALKDEKHATHLKFVLGLAYLNMGKPARALKMLEPVRYEFPYDIDLNIIYIRACLEAKEYDRALAGAEECYSIDKSNFVLIGLLADGYQMKKEYGEAAAVLMEAFENPAFLDRQYVIGSRTAYILFLDKKYPDSLEWLERLTALKADEEEKDAFFNVFMAMLDYFIGKHMFREAGRCAGAILGLMPDREDVAMVKKGIDVILSVESEIDRFDRDEFIPDLLKIYIASGIGELLAADQAEEQHHAYMALLERQLLSDFSSYLIAVRYMKTNYPALYRFKAGFLDAFQNSRERKKLENKNKVIFCRYQDVIAKMLEEMSAEYFGDEDGWDDDPDGWHDDDEYDEDEYEEYDEYDDDCRDGEGDWWDDMDADWDEDCGDDDNQDGYEDRVSDEYGNDGRSPDDDEGGH